MGQKLQEWAKQSSILGYGLGNDDSFQDILKVAEVTRQEWAKQLGIDICDSAWLSFLTAFGKIQFALSRNKICNFVKWNYL